MSNLDTDSDIDGIQNSKPYLVETDSEAGQILNRYGYEYLKYYIKLKAKKKKNYQYTCKIFKFYKNIQKYEKKKNLRILKN